MLQRSDPQGLLGAHTHCSVAPRPQMALQGWPAGPSAGLGEVGAASCSLSPPLLATPPSSAGLNFIPQSGIVFSPVGNSVMTGYDPPPPHI